MMMSSAFDDHSGGRTPPKTPSASGDTLSAHPAIQEGYANDELHLRPDLPPSLSVPIFTQKDVHSEIASMSSLQNTTMVEVEFPKNGIELSLDTPAAPPMENEHGRIINVVHPTVIMNYNENKVSSFPSYDDSVVGGDGEGLRAQGSVKVEDALNYLDTVKYRYSHQPEIYSNFLDIMKEFKSQTIGTACVMERVSNLFQGHPDLILGFNVFLPEDTKFTSVTPLVQQYQNVNLAFAQLTSTRCTPTPGDDQRYRDPVSYVIPDNTILPNQGVSISISAVGNFSTSSDKIAATTSPQASKSPSSQHVLPVINEKETLPGPIMFQHPVPYRELQKAEAVITGNNQDLEYQQAINYVNTIKQRLTSEQYRQFLEILHGYQKQQRRTGESPNSEFALNDWDIYVKISKLFEDHVDLLQEFIKYVPASSHVIRPIIATKLKNLRHKAQGSTRVPKKGKGLERSRTSLQHVGDTQANSNVTSSRSASTNIRPMYACLPNTGSRSSVPVEPMTRDSMCFKGFETFLNEVQKLLSTARYEDFLRVLLLFNKDVISYSELIRTVGDLLHKDRDIFKWFKLYASPPSDDDDLKSSNAIDQSETLANSSDDNQELEVELDTSMCRRIGKSYCRVPKNYQHPKCSGKTTLCEEVLNDEWLSVPMWTEGAACVIKKMPYEEIMFRTEDERFECDFVIQTNMEAMMHLEIVNRSMQEMSEEERKNFQLDECLGGRSTIHLRAIRRIYGDEQAPKIIEGLKQCPSVAVPVVLKRLKQKDEEWRAVQKESNKIWEEQMQKYYLKSLDHTGNGFKQADNKRPK